LSHISISTYFRPNIHQNCHENIHQYSPKLSLTPKIAILGVKDNYNDHCPHPGRMIRDLPPRTLFASKPPRRLNLLRDSGFFFVDCRCGLSGRPATTLYSTRNGGQAKTPSPCSRTAFANMVELPDTSVSKILYVSQSVY
jgi:hypothetical protein